MTSNNISASLAELPNVVGTLVTTREGNIISSTGELDGKESTRLLLELLRDVNGLLAKSNGIDKTLNRLTINLGDTELQTTLDAQHVYLVKKQH